MTDPPTLYEWIGGKDALMRLITAFYARVLEDPLIGPLFASMDAEHPSHVADFIGEVIGGPPAYSEHHGGHPEMIRHHLNKHITEAQRRRWFGLLLDTYTDLGLPADPEFASAFVGYLEWGTRIAVITSNDDEPQIDENAPMPAWGWGNVGGPYQPETNS